MKKVLEFVVMLSGIAFVIGLIALLLSTELYHLNQQQLNLIMSGTAVCFVACMFVNFVILPLTNKVKRAI